MLVKIISSNRGAIRCGIVVFDYLMLAKTIVVSATADWVRSECANDAVAVNMGFAAL